MEQVLPSSASMESMLNSVLRHFGYYQEPRLLTEFLAFKETVESAKAAGLSVGDYIDSKQFSGPRSLLIKPSRGWSLWVCSTVALSGSAKLGQVQAAT